MFVPTNRPIPSCALPSPQVLRPCRGPGLKHASPHSLLKQEPSANSENRVLLCPSPSPRPAQGNRRGGGAQPGMAGRSPVGWKGRFEPHPFSDPDQGGGRRPVPRPGGYFWPRGQGLDRSLDPESREGQDARVGRGLGAVSGQRAGPRGRRGRSGQPRMQDPGRDGAAARPSPSPGREDQRTTRPPPQPGTRQLSP